MKKNIPESVIKKAQELVNLYGDTLSYVGEYKGNDVYQFVFPEDSETGFPFIYLHDLPNDQVVEITGFDALDIIGEIVND